MKALITGCFAAFLTVCIAVSLAEAEKPKNSASKNNKQGKQPSPAAVERTRDTVKMLDDIYKQIIILVTDKYVHDEDDFAAGSAAVELFRKVSKTGFHDVRLIDVTGEPYEPENVAKSDFEKQAVKKIKAGEGYVEEVVNKDGKPFLLAMTAVPVVLDKCIMCHSHYGDVKKGAAIGAVSYEMPIR